MDRGKRSTADLTQASRPVSRTRQPGASRRRLSVLLAFLPALLLVPACSDDDPAAPDPDFSDLTVNQVVESAGGFPFILPDSSAFASARFDSSAADDDLSCTTYTGSQRIAVEQLTILAAQTDLHHPGSILQFASLTTANLLPLIADRAGGTLVLTTPAGAEVTGTVDLIDGPAVAAWRQESLASLGETEPGAWQLQVRAVHSNAHLALSAGVPQAAMPVAVSEHLALRDETSGRALVRLQRAHHTVTAPRPAQASAAFGPEVEGADLEGQLGPGNPPVWVQAVEHGQLVLVLVEAAATSTEVAAAALRTFTAARDDQAPEPGPLLGELPDLGVRVFAVGAEAETMVTATLAGLQPLTAALAAPPPSAADLPPVSAELVALRNGETARFAANASFAFDLCEPYEAVFETVLWSYRAADAQTLRLSGDLDTDGQGTFLFVGGSQLYTFDHVVRVPDLQGSGGDALPAGRLPVLHHDAVNGHPAFELYELPMPTGVLHSNLKFDGSALTGRSYTLFVVIGLPSFLRLTVVTSSGDIVTRQLNDLNYFLHGTGTNPRNNLKIGHPDPEHMLFSHTGTVVNELEFIHDRQWGWHVYAFRFGTASGMTAFMDGELLAHADRTNSLHSYPGATLSARWLGQDGYSLAAVLIAEIVAYAGDGTDEQVLAEMARLQARYGL